MTEHNALLTVILFGIEALIGLAFIGTLGTALVVNRLASKRKPSTRETN